MNALAFVLALMADTKATPTKPALPSAAAVTAFSSWRLVAFEREPGKISLLEGKDFNDTRFEYRWTTESGLNGDACSIEIRLASDAGRPTTIPTIDFAYKPRHGRNRFDSAKDVVVAGPGGHAHLKAQDCDSILTVSWSK